MHKIINGLVLVVIASLLWGCGDKLTGKAAAQIIENEILAARATRGFTRMAFEEGTSGYAYFQKLIADGTLVLEKEEERTLSVLSRTKAIAKIYVGSGDDAAVFQQVEIKQVIPRSSHSVSDMMDIARGAKKEAPPITICEGFVKIKKEAIKSIDSIFNDEKEGTAIVKLTVAEVGIAPYYDDLCPLMYPGESAGYGECGLRTYSREVPFKKYDEGWKIAMKLF
jgi:hypothetical protein